MKYKKEELQLQINVQDKVVDRIEATWFMINPELARAVLKDKVKDEEHDDSEQVVKELTADNFDDEWSKIMEVIPHSIPVPKEVVDSRRFFTHRLSRREFIDGISIKQTK